jgi:hypothetical protein
MILENYTFCNNLSKSTKMQTIMSFLKHFIYNKL